MGFGERSGRACQVLVVSVALAGSAGCGASSDSASGAPTDVSTQPSATVASAAATASASPAASELPTTLDKAKFCKAIDEAAIAAAMGVPIATRSTKGLNPNSLYCSYGNKTKTGGVNVTWNPKPKNPIRELRKVLENSPDQIQAACKFADVATLDPDLAFQESCEGYKVPLKFFPRHEMFFFQIGETSLSCQVWAAPKQDLAVDADGVASLCQGVVTALT